MAGGTQLANVLDSIPYFETTGERDARFPSPDLRQRAQVGNTLYQWDGSWSEAPWVGGLGRYNVRDRQFAGGAAGDGVADDTAAIQAALAAAPVDSDGGKAVYLPMGKYLVTDTLVADTNRVYFTGDGPWATKIIFNPSTPKTLFKFALGGTGTGELFSGGIDGISLRSSNAVAKVGIELIDTSNIVVRDFEIHHSFGNNGSTGILTKGREMFTLNRAVIAASNPIVIGVNPNASSGVVFSCDHFHLFDLWIITLDATKYAITIEDGAELHHLIFDGYQSWNGGLGGLYWNDTSSSVTADGIVIENVRLEQAAAGGWFVYLSHNASLKGTRIANIDGQSAGGKNGIYLHKVNQFVGENWLLDGLGGGDTVLECNGTGVTDVTLRNVYGGSGAFEFGTAVKTLWQPGAATGSVAYGHLAQTAADTQVDTLAVAGTQVVGARGAAVADASGGSTVDAEARTAINTLLARLRAHGLIGT